MQDGRAVFSCKKPGCGYSASYAVDQAGNLRMTDG